MLWAVFGCLALIWYQYCQHVSGVMFYRLFAESEYDRANIPMFSGPMVAEARGQYLKAKTKYHEPCFHH